MQVQPRRSDCGSALIVTVEVDDQHVTLAMNHGASEATMPVTPGGRVEHEVRPADCKYRALGFDPVLVVALVKLDVSCHKSSGKLMWTPLKCHVAGKSLTLRIRMSR